MGITVVKGVAGQYQAQKSTQYSPQTVQALGQIAKSAALVQDAAVSFIRSPQRTESSERLTPQKAEKLAKDLGEDITSNPDEALNASIGRPFSGEAVRGAFGV